MSHLPPIADINRNNFHSIVESKHKARIADGNERQTDAEGALTSRLNTDPLYSAVHQQETKLAQEDHIAYTANEAAGKSKSPAISLKEGDTQGLTRYPLSHFTNVQREQISNRDRYIDVLEKRNGELEKNVDDFDEHVEKMKNANTQMAASSAEKTKEAVNTAVAQEHSDGNNRAMLYSGLTAAGALTLGAGATYALMQNQKPTAY